MDASIKVEKPNLEAIKEGKSCPKCGCKDYKEWQELEYEKGDDDPMYGGRLILVDFSRCQYCD